LRSSGWRSSGLRVEPTLVRLMTKVGLYRVPEATVIFDSLVLSSRHDTDIRLRQFGYGVMNPASEFQNVVEQSQQKLNCALLVEIL